MLSANEDDLPCQLLTDYLYYLSKMNRLLYSLYFLLVTGYTCAFSSSRARAVSRSIVLKRDAPTATTSFSAGIDNTSRRWLARQNGDSDDTSYLSTPLDRPVLALVDAASLLTFAAVGKASHAPDGSIDLFATASVAFPFLLAWFATSPFTGVYSQDERAGNLILETFIKSGKGWIFAIPLGCVIRGLIKGYVPPVPFVVVTMIATFVILGLGRLLFAVIEDFFVELAN